MNPDLETLATRCEAAVYPARTDAEAAELVSIQKAICDLMHRDCDAYSPDYLGSLDAAMTLVPKGWFVILDDLGAYGLPSTRLHTPEGMQAVVGIARNLKLALCAAALRARGTE